MKKKGLIITICIAAVAIAAVIVGLIIAKNSDTSSGNLGLGYRSIEIYEVGSGTQIIRDGVEMSAFKGLKLYAGDKLTVPADEYAHICLDGDKYIYLEANTGITIREASGSSGSGRTVVFVDYGNMTTELRCKLSDDSIYEIETPNTSMAIRGTITMTKVVPLSNGQVFSSNYVYESKVAYTVYTEEDGQVAASECSLKAGEGLSLYGESVEPENRLAIETKSFTPETLVEHLSDNNIVSGITGLEIFDIESVDLDELVGNGEEKKAIFCEGTEMFQIDINGNFADGSSAVEYLKKRAAEQTAEPVVTSEPTATPEPTSTPVPTATATPFPSATPVPSHTISFEIIADEDIGDVYESPEDMTAYEGDTNTLPTPAIRDTYEFDGWYYITESSSSVEDVVSSEVKIPLTDGFVPSDFEWPEGDITLVGYIHVIEVSVSFEYATLTTEEGAVIPDTTNLPNSTADYKIGTTFTTTPGTVTGSEVVFPTPLDANGDYIVVGWSTTQGGTSVSSYTLTKNDISGVTFYAVWAETVDITFKFTVASGLPEAINTAAEAFVAELNKNFPTLTVAKGDAPDIPCLATYLGSQYTSNGWTYYDSAEQEYTNELEADVDGISDDFTNNDGRLEAIISPVYAIVSYNVNPYPTATVEGLSIPETTATSDAYYLVGTEVSLPELQDASGSYTFAGWSLTDPTSGSDYEIIESTYTITTADTEKTNANYAKEPVYFYAVWNKKES